LHLINIWICFVSGGTQETAVDEFTRPVACCQAVQPTPQGDIQRMTRSAGNQMAGNIETGECQITNDVENLVPGWLIAKSQFIAHNPGGAEDQQVFE
jgi:hypothetical protein